MEFLLFVAALLWLVGGTWWWKRACRTSSCALRGVRATASGLSLLLAVLLLAGSGYTFWYAHRPLPDSRRETIFEGITYSREVRREPRPLVIHVLLVDLDAPGIRFRVTPGDPSPNGEIRARTTSHFLEEFDLQVAINGDFFKPWWSYSPWNYYPRVGDPVDVAGLAVSNGVPYSIRRSRNPATLYLTRDNRASIGVSGGDVYNAISGNTIFVRQGIIRIQPEPYHEGLHPRTAVALDRAKRTLILVVVDGRQPNYSEGVTLEELAEIVIEHGGDTALNLDGGGSATMVIERESGGAMQLNSPIDNLIPGRERPVANHLGIYARRTNSSVMHQYQVNPYSRRILPRLSILRSGRNVSDRFTFSRSAKQKTPS